MMFCVDLSFGLNALMDISNLLFCSPFCRCRWFNGNLPFHDWCLWSEVPWRVQPACAGMDGQLSVSGHWLFGHAVHRGIGPPPHVSHSGEIHLHRLPFPVLDPWLAKNCLYTSWDLGFWLHCCLFAAGLQGALPQLLRDQWSLFSSAFWAARDTLGLRVLHCNFPGWEFASPFTFNAFHLSSLLITFSCVKTQYRFLLKVFTLISIWLPRFANIFNLMPQLWRSETVDLSRNYNHLSLCRFELGGISHYCPLLRKYVL